MKQMFIPEKVVFHIEPNEQVGTIHDLKSGERAYVNADTVEIIRHLIKGNTLDSFKYHKKKKKSLFDKVNPCCVNWQPPGF